MRTPAFYCASSGRVQTLASFSFGLAWFLFAGLLPAKAITATTTTLALTSEGHPVTVAEPGAVITLTAMVHAGPAALTVGQVRFCDAEAASCENFQLLQTAQLTKAGTAVFRFIPGAGSHSYKAVFAGTTANESSTSDAMPLIVTGKESPFQSKTSLTSAGSAGSYTLSADISGVGSGTKSYPTGIVYFQDRSDSEAVLGKALIPAGSPAVNYTTLSADLRKNPEGFGMVVADFNGDGKPDLGICGDEEPHIALGNGDGTFQSLPSVIAVSTSCNSILVGDFNSDGIADLAVSYRRKSVSFANLYLGLGNGQLSEPVKLFSHLHQETFLIGVGDFDHDGNVDLLMNYMGTISVLLGKGDGKFKAGWQTPPPARYASFISHNSAVGDFNGDGIEDFAFISYDEQRDGPEIVTLFLGQGDGTFAESDYRTPLASALAMGDFNGDGVEDLAVSSLGPAGFGPLFPRATLLLGNKTGTLAQQLISTDAPTRSIIVDDFNQDGIADLAFSPQINEAIYGPDTTEIFLGNGDASFTRALRSGPGTSMSLTLSSMIVAADFNSDGLPDVAGYGLQTGSGKWAYGVELTQLGKSAAASIRPPSGPGNHQVVARYKGDDSFITSVSRPVTLNALTTAAAVATFSALSVTFADQEVGTLSNASTVILTNTGTAPLAFDSISLAPFAGPGVPFATLNNCPATLAPQTACKIRFRFSPTKEGVRTSKVTITDNAANSPQTIILTGVGVLAQ